MFSFNRNWRDLIERQYDFLVKQYDGAMDRIDGIADDRKEYQQVLTAVRAEHDEQMRAVRKRLEAAERHISNLYGWTMAVANRYGLEQPPAPEYGSPELSDEDIQQRQELLDRVLDNPMSAVGFNAEDLLAEPGLWDEMIEREDHAPADEGSKEREAQGA